MYNFFVCFCVCFGYFIFFSLNFQQWADYKAAVPHRPSVCVAQRHGGSQKDQAWATVLALSASQWGRGVRKVDYWAWSSCKFNRAGKRPGGCNGQCIYMLCLFYTGGKCFNVLHAIVLNSHFLLTDWLIGFYF